MLDHPLSQRIKARSGPGGIFLMQPEFIEKLRWILTKNCEFRAHLFTEMATYTVQRFCNERRVISLSVELIGHLQNLAWAEFHAEATSFASVLNNINNGRWRQFFFPIKGFSPHLHGHDPIPWTSFLCIRAFLLIPSFAKGGILTSPFVKGDFLYVISHLIELFVNHFFGYKGLYLVTDFGADSTYLFKSHHVCAWFMP